MFISRAAATCWIKEGWIAELQDSMCHLGIGFSKDMVVMRDPVNGAIKEPKKKKIFVMSRLYDLAAIRAEEEDERERHNTRRRNYDNYEDMPF